MSNRHFLTGEKENPPYRLRHKTKTTQLLAADDPGTISAVTVAILRGELIILPTDTVYGVGASASDEEAIRSLYIVKQRSASKGIPILIADKDDLGKVAAGLADVDKNSDKKKYFISNGMILQESGPGLARSSTHLGHVLLNRPLADPNTELQQLTTDTLGAPQPVFLGHLPDEGDRFRCDTRFPLPIPCLVCQ